MRIVDTATFTSTPTRTNLVTNPSFEVDITGWQASGASGGAATIARSTSWAAVGTASVAVTCTTAGNVSVVQTAAIAKMPVSPGQTYTAQATARTAIAGRGLLLQINWQDSAGVFLSSVQGPPVTSTANTNLYLSVTATAPVNAAYCTIEGKATAAAVNDVYNWDAFILEQSATGGVYFDGNQSGRWTGTANASTSVQGGEAVVPDRRNLVVNPSFEVDTSKWGIASGSATLARSTTWAAQGTASMQVTCTTAGDVTVYKYDVLPLVAGRYYTAQCVVRSGVAGRQVQLGLDWARHDGTWLADVYGQTTNLAAGTNQLLTLTGIAPAGTASCNLLITFTGMAANETANIDAVCLEEGSLVQPYFDGSSVGCRWTGTAHNSISEKVLDVGGAQLSGGGITLTGGATITGFPAPAAAGDMATKSYVDGLIVAPQVQVFTSSGTWTKPAGAVAVQVLVVGGGGGGGGGRRGVTTSPTQYGGGGGGGGGRHQSPPIPASALPATVSVTVGAGGSAGAGATVDNTNGGNGGFGGITQFGTYAIAYGGGWGTGGGSGTGGDAGNEANGTRSNGSGGFGASNYGADGNIRPGGSAAGGGGGGHVAPSTYGGGGPGGLSNGTTFGAASANGTSAPTNSGLPGNGGGGGNAVSGGAGGKGGNGGLYGAGGGGGGASANGFASGAAGTGGAGICIVTTYF